MKKSITCLSFFLAFCPVAFGQLTEATLKGFVTDASTRVVNSASVTVINANTGERRSAVTDSAGSYVLPGLTPGSYVLNLSVQGFRTFTQAGIQLNVGQTAEVNVRLELGSVTEHVEVSATVEQVQVARDPRLADNYSHKQIADLPLPQRDIFSLPKLSAGATAIPGAANSTKLTNSPVITVNGNRYRGNNYVLDGSMNTNPNNTGEPAIVPSLESVEEAQVQTGNFSGEFGRGNGAVVNLRTKSGTNQLHGKLWEYLRNADLNARNFFAAARPPQSFNQFGANIGAPIRKDRTFLFASYEGSRNSFASAQTFQVETPEFRNYVFATAPNSIAATLLRKYPAVTPLAGSATRYKNEVDIKTALGTIPGTGLATALLHDFMQFDQYMLRLDHSLNNGKDKITGRWISEFQQDAGGTASAKAALGKATRGQLGPYSGSFGNMNLGEVHLFGATVNDVRLSFQNIYVTVGNAQPVVPEINITGVTAPFGDIVQNGTRLRTYELRDTVSFERGRHAIRLGVEGRRIFKGLSISPPSPGSYFFNNLLDFAADKPYQQVLTVNPQTGAPTNFPRYFTLYESGIFFQDDWRATRRLNVSLGIRHDYFGTVTERHGLLSSLVFGQGLADASIQRVNRLYNPQKTNFSPRIGLAYDPFGSGRTSLRAGFSIAYQPHHGQSISGARALPPDAVQGVLQPNVGIGSQIIYSIPIQINPQFATGLNTKGGINGVLSGKAPRITGFVVNPNIKTQYSESWFFNIQHEIAATWVAEIGYVGTNGVNLERIENINRVDGDLLDGKFNGINPNFGPLLFVTNGVNSSYNAFTAEIRHSFGRGFNLLANYRWSKWIDDGSDTSTGQFLDNDQPGKGAQNVNCLKCERGLSMFDIPHRFSATGLWTPKFFDGKTWRGRLANHWEIAGVFTAQSGRPFSVWNGASLAAGGDYNADGGGGAVGGGYYDRPNAPAPGVIKSSFSQSDFLNGLFSPTAFPSPTTGTDGNLGRNTFRGPHQITLDLAVSRSFPIREHKSFALRVDAFNALNKTNLYLPNTDLSLALLPNKTFSTTSSFGKSTASFDARAVQASLRFIF